MFTAGVLPVNGGGEHMWQCQKVLLLTGDGGPYSSADAFTVGYRSGVVDGAASGNGRYQ